MGFGRRIGAIALGLACFGCRRADEPAESVESAQTLEVVRTHEAQVESEPPCARADGYLRAVEFVEVPAGFRAGHELVDERLPLDPRLDFRIVGEPTFEEGLLRVSATLANSSDETIDLDVMTGGVAGLSSLPFTLRLDPPPRSRPGLGQESFRRPEVYPGPIRWTIPANSELRLNVRECVARHELPPGSRLRVHYALETASEPKPRGMLDVVVPDVAPAG